MYYNKIYNAKFPKYNVSLLYRDSKICIYFMDCIY